MSEAFSRRAKSYQAWSKIQTPIDELNHRIIQHNIIWRHTGDKTSSFIDFIFQASRCNRHNLPFIIQTHINSYDRSCSSN